MMAFWCTMFFSLLDAAALVLSAMCLRRRHACTTHSRVAQAWREVKLVAKHKPFR